MKIVEQNAKLLNKQDYETAVRLVESAGRLCYQSEPSKDLEGAEKFINNLIKAGHESVVEHLSISMLLTTNRNISHQIVRHRIASYSQLSSRYVVQGGEFGIEVIPPAFPIGSDEYEIFRTSVESAEHAYNKLKSMGVKNDLAREVLPGCIKTELVMTANVREWRHFFRLRCDKASHYQIRELAKLALIKAYNAYPCFFEDLYLEFITW